MSNKIFALIGPYASGKATFIGRLKDLGVHYIPIYSTEDVISRKKLPGLVNYTTKNEFETGEWVVKVATRGHYYGFKKKDMLKALQSSEVSVMMIDQKGVKQLTKLISDHFNTVYLMTDYMTLVDRMLHMGLNSEEIKYCLENAETNNEFDGWKDADYVIKNVGSVDVAMNQLMAIMGLPVNVDCQKEHSAAKK